MGRTHFSTKSNSTATLEIPPRHRSRSHGKGPNAEVSALLTEIGAVLHWTKQIKESMKMERRVPVAEVVC